MSDKSVKYLDESLKGYKQNVSNLVKGTLEWDKDLIFVGKTNEGYEIEFDANVQYGCKPTDALLLSLAGCMGIDMVMFLQKMKMKLEKFKIDIIGQKKKTSPQYYTDIEMTLHIEGKNLDAKKVEQAISLSREKYCSVYHSLRKDINVKVTYTLKETD